MIRTHDLHVHRPRPNPNRQRNSPKNEKTLYLGQMRLGQIISLHLERYTCHQNTVMKIRVITGPLTLFIFFYF